MSDNMEQRDDALRETNSALTEQEAHNLSVADPLLDRLERLETVVSGLNTYVNKLTEKVELIPARLRQLGTQVDSLTESVSHPRVRDLLMSYINLYDLIEQVRPGAAPDSESARHYHVLASQIVQTLHTHGITLITDLRQFDPNLHKAVEIVSCSTIEEQGEIVAVYRNGFHTEHGILRYAEVVVKRYELAVDTAGENP